MLSDVRVQLTVGLLLAVTAQACAEGTKVDAGGEPTTGNGGAPKASGGATTNSSGGKSSTARGGNVGIGGSSLKLGSGGMTSSSSPASSGGATVSVGGTVSTSATTQGGDTTAAGSPATGSGGSASSTVAPPAEGLGIQILTQQLKGGGQCATNLALVNQGGITANLTTVKIRYYFTIDSWTAPVFVIDYAGQIIGSSAIKSSLFTLPTPQPDADRYFELTFTAGSLGIGGRLEINSRLYDLQNLPMTVTNDYSFTGAVGFTDHITVYDGTKLVWGVEPGKGNAGGTGGASGIGEGGAGGVAGAYATGFGGAVTVQGGVANTSTSTGSAGTPSTVANAGAAGLAESTGFAGTAGYAGSN